ncbi:hypothetical protein FSP39_000681 [Pinctada imbricata]|uniref:Uncharacterized protein n=1 Tax=Pinctada imbricata TaxID=66713 RepID=A0AA89CBD4_PINIB|nr:hypothetical protein FSP39_000681 [Pinctada imbricata]
MGYLFPLLFANFVCVSTQVIKGDHICANDDSRELNYLSEVVRQQAMQIKELYERVYAQDDDGTKNIPGQFGKEFILAFPEVNTTLEEIQLLIVSKGYGQVSLLSDEPGIDRVVNISAINALSLTLPNTLLSNGSYVGRNTVLLTSSTDIAVFVVVLSPGSGDGYMAIPATSLQTYYFFSMNRYAMLSIVAFYNETLIRFSSDAGTVIDLQSIGLSNTSDIVLDRGQVLQIKHVSWVMGHVAGSKPFMLLHGSYRDLDFSHNMFSHIDSVTHSDANLFIIPCLLRSNDSVTFCNNPGNDFAISDRHITTFTDYILSKTSQKSAISEHIFRRAATI